MSDGNLRKLFQKHLPEIWIVPIESWSTGQGVPDAWYVAQGGICGWIENKKTDAWKVGLEKEQAAWLERCVRMGGRCFVAVRRSSQAGPKKGPACDELWLFHGRDARALMLGGLRDVEPLGVWENGPKKWNWAVVKECLTA